MRLTVGVVMLAIILLAGCAPDISNIRTVAPKFTGHPVEDMAVFFGAPERVSDVGNLSFYEWRIGEYGSEPDRIHGHVSGGGSVSGTVERGNTKFLGCIVEAMVDEHGVVTRVTVDSRTGTAGDVHDIYGCSKLIHDPFFVATE